ncbi:MAG: molecular chaperone HscC, partial [Robiginitomaculum sp.]
MALVGIDLGTTNSLISVFTDDGPQLIPNALGRVLTPSAVGLSDDGEMIIGEAARNRLVSHPDKSYARFKRYMGANREFKMGRKSYRAEELSAMVLRSLKDDAERHLGTSVERAIISVPAYFNDVQRKATYAAGKLAGLTIERLINEPTAAALAYGLNMKDDESTFLVVDLGGGTFDVSILEIFEGVMEVRSSSGDAFLGGEDFTDKIFEHFAEQIGKPFAKMGDKKKSLLRDLADKAKVQLSSAQEAGVNFNGPKGMIKLSLTREKFDEICAPLVKRLRQPIQRAIMDAGLRAADIDRVITVGGATRMPIVRATVTRLLKLFPEHSLDPDHVIGLGAAVQAGLLDRHEALEDIVMTDVSPFTLGTEIAIEIGTGNYEAGHFQPIIERNTVIPVSRVVTNSTINPGQKELLLQIYQGESPHVVDNVLLGKLHVPVPQNNKKETEAFDVRFT